jgi:hypothetical protein
MAASMAAKTRLMSEFKGLQKEKWVNIEVCAYKLPLKDVCILIYGLSLRRRASSNGLSP